MLQEVNNTCECFLTRKEATCKQNCYLHFFSFLLEKNDNGIKFHETKPFEFKDCAKPVAKSSNSCGYVFQVLCGKKAENIGRNYVWATKSKCMPASVKTESNSTD
ncbi:hypothetical protein HS088_TW11G00414 [Tripterygium wilfordii]|uniref:Uncharacterized protein n=1 Tax=Tripterygium wilfordii TaxID=458696 RepID=A0A7J7D1X1_TRIWF|nr:hypothetical protein HS088_TW11G00414 [Tripterygium wilfordii]